MATKTWKIGEYCKGGIITVETTKTKVTIIGKEWNHANGGRKSKQKNNREWTRLTVDVSDENGERRIFNFLNDLTTSWYRDNIIEWIETKVKFKNIIRW